MCMKYQTLKCFGICNGIYKVCNGIYKMCRIFSITMND